MNRFGAYEGSLIHLRK